MQWRDWTAPPKSQPLTHGTITGERRGESNPRHTQRERERAFIIPQALLSEQLGQFQQKVNNWFNYKTNFPRALQPATRELSLARFSLPLLSVNAGAPQVGESLTSSGSLCANEWGNSGWPFGIGWQEPVSVGWPSLNPERERDVGMVPMRSVLQIFIRHVQKMYNWLLGCSEWLLWNWAVHLHL